MNHLPDPELFSAYLDGELTAEQQAKMERLLATSAEARQLLEDLRTISQSLQSLPVHKLSEDLTPQILQEAERRRQSAMPAAALSASTVPAPGPDGGIGTSAHARGESPGLAVSGGPAPRQASGQSTPRPRGRWNSFFRRLFNSRGILWSSAAVAVAVFIWWFGPPSAQPVREVAQVPRASAPLSDKADAESPATEEKQNGGTGVFRRGGPTGAAIRARSSEESFAASDEKSPAWAAPRLAAKEPPTDRARQSLPEAASVASEQGVPTPPHQEAAKRESPSEQTPPAIRGKSTSGAVPSPSALAGTGQGLAMEKGKGFGAGKTPGPETPPPVLHPQEGRPTTEGLLNRRTTENLLARSLGAGPTVEGGVPPALPGSPPPQQAMAKYPSASKREEILRKAVESEPDGKPAAPPPVSYGPPGPAMANRDSAPSAALPKQGGTVEMQRQMLPSVIPDTTMVVVCDLSAPALQQRSFEQILSNQQIVIQEGEEAFDEMLEVGREGPHSVPSVSSSLEASKATEINRPGPQRDSPSSSPPGLPEQASIPSQNRQKKIAKNQVSADHRRDMADRAGSAPGQPSHALESLENQLQFVLVEARPEQLEGALKAMQARPDEFLSVSISPAAADPAQQMYQQYARVYQFRGPLGGEGQSVGRSQLSQTLQSSPSGKDLPAQASEPAKPHTLESTKEKILKEKILQEAVQKAPPPEVDRAEANGTALAAQNQQPIRTQQAWARRLRLPDHLSQQFSFPQQQSGRFPEQLQRQASAASQTPSSQPLDKQASSSDGLKTVQIKPGQDHGAGAGVQDAKTATGPSYGAESEKTLPGELRPETVWPTEKPSADPARSMPPRASEQVPPKEVRKTDGQGIPSLLPAPTERSSVPKDQQSRELIRVLFVLRPAEAAP